MEEFLEIRTDASHMGRMSHGETGANTCWSFRKWETIDRIRYHAFIIEYLLQF